MRRCSRRSQSSRTSFKCRDSSTVALCNAASSPIRSLAAARIFTSRGTERPGRKVVISARKELLLLVWRMAGPGGCHSTVQLTRASGSAARCLIDLHIPYTLRIRDQHVISQCKARNNAIDYLSILRGYRLMRSSMSTRPEPRRSAVQSRTVSHRDRRCFAFKQSGYTRVLLLLAACRARCTVQCSRGPRTAVSFRVVARAARSRRRPSRRVVASIASSICIVGQATWHQSHHPRDAFQSSDRAMLAQLAHRF
jgi:hypothetical protein